MQFPSRALYTRSPRSLRPELEVLEARCVLTAITTPPPDVEIVNPDQEIVQQQPVVPVVTTGAVGSSFVPNANTLAQLPPSDDGSFFIENIGFTINVGGVCYNSLYVNNNGSVTFGSPMGTPYTPVPLNTTGLPIIAPFFADVTTFGPITQDGQEYANVVTTAQGTVGDHNAFAVTWIDVDFYHSFSTLDKFNTSQIVIVQRSDRDSECSTGNFDFELNYNSINWETGDASGGSNGLGGTSARVGYALSPEQEGGNAQELPGSGVNGALLDGGPNALVDGNRNSSVAGQYLFHVHDGQVEQLPTFINAPSLLTLNVGEALSASFQASDPQELPITYSLVPTSKPGSNAPPEPIPAGLQIDPETGVLTWAARDVPSVIQDTTFSFAVCATDSGGNFVKTNVHVTVLTKTSIYKTAILNAGETATIQLPNASLIITQADGTTGSVTCGLGWYTGNPAPVNPPSGTFLRAVDLWMLNDTNVSSATLTMQIQPGTGPHAFWYLNQAGVYVPIPDNMQITEDDLRGHITITITPPFTIFGFTVFAVTAANTVSQPTVVTPPTAQANSSSNRNVASDVSPSTVQTINFISTTQLTVTVSAAQNSQQTATGNSKGSQVATTASTPGLPTTPPDTDQAPWNDGPLYLIAPVPAPIKRKTPTPPPDVKPPETEELFDEQDPDVDVARGPRGRGQKGLFASAFERASLSSLQGETVALAQGENAHWADGNLWANLSSDDDFRDRCLPPALVSEPRQNASAPALAVALPLLALGEKLAANYRDKEREREPLAFQKAAFHTKAQKAQRQQKEQKKKRVQKQKRIERAERIKSNQRGKQTAGPVPWAFLVLGLFAVCAFV